MLADRQKIGVAVDELEREHCALSCEKDFI
jgi:hypothetical protein